MPIGSPMSECPDATEADMTGFSPETFAYLNDLSVNNNRDWFEDNRKPVRGALARACVGFHRRPGRSDVAVVTKTQG